MLTAMIAIPICCEVLSRVVPENKFKILTPSRNLCRHPPDMPMLHITVERGDHEHQTHELRDANRSEQSANSSPVKRNR